MDSPATALGISMSVNNAIGYLGSKPGYEREWPDRNPASALSASLLPLERCSPIFDWQLLSVPELRKERFAVSVKR